MRSLLYPALIAVFTLYFSCTPKNAPKISGNPAGAPEPAWDTLGKPGMNEEEEDVLDYNLMDDIVVEPQSLSRCWAK